MKMNFEKIKKATKEYFLDRGYSRAARELLQLDDRYLKNLGISRELLKQGYAAYPWREETAATIVNVNNVTTLKPAINEEQTQILPETPIAA